MIRFSKEKILLLHQLLAEETGGASGIRDQAMLESAIESAFVAFDGKDLFPSKAEKAARLGYALISNHAFVDGNKRIGVYAMLTFLEMNGVRMQYSTDEIVHIGMSVADGTMGYEALLEWILAHICAD